MTTRQNDETLVALWELGLSDEQIGMLLRVSARSIYRMRNRLGLEANLQGKLLDPKTGGPLTRDELMRRGRGIMAWQTRRAV